MWGKGKRRAGSWIHQENRKRGGKKREHIGLRGGAHGMIKHCEYVGKHRDFMKQRDRQEKGAVKSAERKLNSKLISVGLVHRVQWRLFRTF